MKKDRFLPSCFLFVCFGNICRSPVLAAVLKHMVCKTPQSDRKITIDSCGLAPSFVGACYHKNMTQLAKERGISLEGTSKLFDVAYFSTFDCIFAVTNALACSIRALTENKEQQQKVMLATHFSSKYRDQDIPDPYYYGNLSSFEVVFDVIEDAAKGIYAHFKFAF